MKKRILCVLTVALIIVFSMVSCIDENNKHNGNEEKDNEHTHAFTEWRTTVAATCVNTGMGKVYCKCGAFIEEEIPTVDHEYLENVCTRCGIHFHETDVYRYNQLKPFAEKIAIYLAKVKIEENLYEYQTVENISAKILESDVYFRYVINITYNLVNTSGVSTKKDRTFVIKVDQNLKLESKYLEVNGNLSACKDSMDWNERPANFSYDFYTSFSSPKKVTISELLNNPQKYYYEYVEIVDNTDSGSGLYITKTDVERASITIGTTSNSTSGIELISQPEIVDLHYLNKNKDRIISACGYVKFYANEKIPYIQLFALELK